MREVLTSTNDFLTPQDIAPIIGCKPYAINLQAKEDPSKLGFPVCLIGTRARIPRMGFLRWCGYEERKD